MESLKKISITLETCIGRGKGKQGTDGENRKQQSMKPKNISNCIS